MSGHVVPVKTYVAVFVALICLTLLTTAAAFVDMGRMNTVVALAIAVTKMLLVILFFMHVKYSPGLTRIVVLAGFFWLAILVALSLADELTRWWSPGAQPWSVLLPFFTGLR
jgi:cytochrome c oxidase subunit IV